MNIVTIMNYNQPKYIKMGKLWIKQLRIHNPNANVFVLHDGSIDKDLHDYLKDHDCVILKKECAPNEQFLGKAKHNIHFKLYNLSRIEDPFIFLDADAIVLDKLDLLWEKKNEKPWIGINHQKIPRHTDDISVKFLNSGVQIVGDPLFYNYEKIINSYQQIGKLLVPGFDQAMLYGYFKSISYDYTHPEIGYGYNACSGYTELYKENNLWRGRCTKLQGDNYSVQINHYWDVFRPWNIKCPMYNENI